ncbi:MAG TPA: restriction endonuclease [Clostridiales bacterium]|nr:MAG: restriction endonuclease [Clostridiales bacterium GWD2_32_59]HAN09703.1 restriction endonuclease [Clostridiales bacterium]
MRLDITDEIKRVYHSNSQIARVITENWVRDKIFCPNCGKEIISFENNRPVADFYCNSCKEEYELKSKNGSLANKIVDGAYSTMIERIESSNNPNFFFLTYNKVSYELKDFLVVPRYIFTKEIIEKRKPLSDTAKRAGWTGCNILINQIPDLGKIFYIKNGIEIEKKQVTEKWRKTNFMKENRDLKSKGWILDVLMCVEKINKKDFTLNEIYKYENILKDKHLQNNNIQAKIRQQLQMLRDKGIIDFTSRGNYRIL